MQAVKVFNNNAVSVVMPDGREAILVGNGLGFGRRPGDVIDKSRVSKVYYVQNELQTKFLKMLDNVTPQVMQAAERISLAAEEQGILLSSKSTISLVDHISFALDAKIVLMTIQCVLSREGISAEGSATMEAFTGTGAMTNE